MSGPQIGMRDLQREVLQWLRLNCDRVGADFPDPITQLAVVAEEVGEVARAVVKAKQGIRPETRGNLEEEIGDVVIALCALASTADIDIQQAVQDRWAVVGQRDWSKTR